MYIQTVTELNAVFKAIYTPSILRKELSPPLSNIFLFIFFNIPYQKGFFLNLSNKLIAAVLLFAN